MRPNVLNGRTRHFLLLLFLAFGTAAAAPPQAAIASAHPLATRAGLQILQQGGNAFDAAVAVSAALAVVEPAGSGLGGGGFWLLHRAKDGKRVMLDGRERAPLSASPAMYLDKDGRFDSTASINGPLSAGIPGMPAALVHLAEQYGRLPLAQSLAPAIHYAREGFPVGEHYRRLMDFRVDVVRRSPAAARIFLHRDDVPEAGFRLVQKELADTLENLVVRGRAGFYGGETARKLVEGVRVAGGIWDLKDLADYKVVERQPVEGIYQGIRIISASPPSSGGVVLIEALNILSGYGLSALDEVTRKHLIVEAMRRAYHDRALYLGDPGFVPMPLPRLLSGYYAAGLRSTIRFDSVLRSARLAGYVTPEVEGENTTHFSILDREGNRVAATLSINLPFGSGFVPPGTGVLLNDEMDDFAAKQDVPNRYGLVGGEANAIAPGKRMLSSMTPTFLEDADRVAILGTPGGSRIISMVLLAVLEFAAGRDPDAWVRLPRFHHQYLPDRVQYEPGGLTEDEIAGLQKLGHRFKPLSRRYGNMQAILWEKSSGTVSAASDPRGEGLSLVQ
jgi:gamma-glutamyltranspeptidase / glutathione hydrolase